MGLKIFAAGLCAVVATTAVAVPDADAQGKTFFAGGGHILDEGAGPRAAGLTGLRRLERPVRGDLGRADERARVDRRVLVLELVDDLVVQQAGVADVDGAVHRQCAGRGG